MLMVMLMLSFGASETAKNNRKLNIRQMFMSKQRLSMYTCELYRLCVHP